MPPKQSGQNAQHFTCSPRGDTDQFLASDLLLSVISAPNLDFNLGLTCCYICIQLILQGCGGGVMLLWQPNNSGQDRRNGISRSRPPKDSETPISAFVSQKRILICYNKQTLLLFFTSFQPLAKKKRPAYTSILFTCHFLTE